MVSCEWIYIVLVLVRFLYNLLLKKNKILIMTEVLVGNVNLSHLLVSFEVILIGWFYRMMMWIKTFKINIFNLWMKFKSQTNSYQFLFRIQYQPMKGELRKVKQHSKWPRIWVSFYFCFILMLSRAVPSWSRFLIFRIK